MVGREIVFIKYGKESIELDSSSRQAQGLMNKFSTGLAHYLGLKPKSIDIPKAFGREEIKIENLGVGNTIYSPRAQVMLELLKSWANNFALNDLKAVRVETPPIYSSTHQPTAQLAKLFDEGLLSSEVGFFRCASDFGVFPLLKRLSPDISREPFRIYELAECCRVEDPKRKTPFLRNEFFHMPDVHSLVSREKVYDEFSELVNRHKMEVDKFGVSFVAAARVTEDEWSRNRDAIMNSCKCFEEMYVNLVPGKRRYWDTKLKWMAVDSGIPETQLATVQVDHLSPKLFGLEGEVSICHSSLGGLERWQGVLINRAEKGISKIPLWLSPCQLRVIRDESLDQTFLAGYRVRVELDNGPASIEDKIRASKDILVANTLVLHGENWFYNDSASTHNKVMKSIEKIQSINLANPYITNGGLRNLRGGLV